MVEVGINLSKLLRDPAGPHKCDVIIALTHARVPNDIHLARSLFSLSPAAQASIDITSKHGVDLVLGGHDHIYWISKGFSGWGGYDLHQVLQDAADDQGDVLVAKSGTDFRDLSEIILTLKDTPAGSVRRKVIESIRGTRHVTRESTKVNENMERVVKRELKHITKAMEEPICKTEVELDVRSSYIRLGESPIGNWIADGLRHAYDEALVKLGYHGTDGVIICTGDLRGDKIYPPGQLTLGDLMTILPFLDPMVVLELDGNALWATLESGLSMWNRQDGRFPAVSGLRVSWNSGHQAGNRVLGVWLQEESMGDDGKPKMVDKEEVQRTSQRKFVIMVGEYMRQGGDGYDILREQKVILGEESGQSKSALIRKFLLGAHYVTKEAHTEPKSPNDYLHPETANIVAAAKKCFQPLSSNTPSILPPIRPVALNLHHSEALNMQLGVADDLVQSVSNSTEQLTSAVTQQTVAPILGWLASEDFYSAAFKVADHEDMNFLDAYERCRSRHLQALTMGARLLMDGADDDKVDVEGEKAKEHLLVIHPVTDGRLKDAAGVAH